MSLKQKAWILAALIVFSIAAAAGTQIWADYQETRQRQKTTVLDITKIVETHIVHTVKQAENTLELIADLIVQVNNAERIREPGRWERLHAYCESLIGCRSIAVLNPTGQIVALSDTPDMPNIDASDRDYFKKAQELKELFIGPALVTRLKDRAIVFPIARPVYDASGKLLAVVTVGITTDHITHFYGLMGFMVEPTVTVFTANGDVVARHPDMRSHVGKNNAKGLLFTTYLPKAPSGVYEAVSVFDGKKRIGAYRSVKDLDLIVFAGIEASLAFQAWKERTVRTVAVIGLVLALILAALYYGYRSVLQQIVLQEKNRELDQLSNLDALTGIANRRLFDIALKRDWARHLRDKAPLSVMLVDVDCFKAYNDNYGHQAGDDCLRKVAQALQLSIHRDADLVARYGGEEFAAVLGSDDQGALIVAERMRSAVESLGIKHDYSSTNSYVTVSIGLASISTSKAKNIEELLRAADTALYEAKSQGRNRVGLQSQTEEFETKRVA